MAVRQLPVPAFFDPGRVGQVWRVPYLGRDEEARTWAARHAIRPAVGDVPRVCLLLIDVQNSFCLPDFELFVAGRSGAGAVEDCRRLCEFIYRNLEGISEVRASLDTHYAMQIFHRLFWVDERGEHPAPMTVITVSDVERGVWQVNPGVAASVTGGDVETLSQHALHYVRQLAINGRYDLIIWPYHGMLGGIGHALVGSVEEAIFVHGVARRCQPWFELKGSNFLTENYSVLAPEVLTSADGQPIAERNRRFVETLLEFDRVIIAGQAKSHCVAWTIDDLLAEIRQVDAALVRKIYLLEDCTSSVVVPGVADFTAQGDAAFARFAAAGMHVVRSTEPMDGWPV